MSYWNVSYWNYSYGTMMRWLLACVLVGTTAHCVLSSRILAVLPIPFKSHQILFQAVLKTLAERGHQVVNYSPFPLNKPLANYTDVRLDTTSSNKYLLNNRREHWLSIPSIGGFLAIWKNIPTIINTVFENNALNDLLQSNETFDLVIIEPLFAQEAFLCLGHKFNVPVVSITSLSSFPTVNTAAGNALSLSYFPDFSLPFTDQMNFYERLVNAYSIIYSLHYYYTQHLPIQETLMRKLYNDSTMPPLVDMVHNISLFMNYAHPYVLYAQPYTPNIVQIGGLHMETDSNSLSKDLQSFLDGAKHGVIYLSMGSIVSDHDMTPEYFNTFLRVFRRLPQRVIWKTGSDLSGLSDNVMIIKWAPQQNILAHPNIALFITHGGLFSMYETINAGVPTVCIPFFGDQRLNCKFYDEKNVGVMLQYKDLCEDTVYSTVSKVLNTKMYKDNMRRLSAIYRDRPVSPADSLVFWVEYVLRHRGAQHLRPASAAMAWYQLVLLDVIAAVLISLCLTIFVLYYIILRLIKSLLKSRSFTPKKLN